MEINLSSVGMEKGRQYETVITTLSPEGKRNAAPIGVICTGKDSIIHENNALIDIANHNIAQIKKDTWIKRNQFTLGVVTGTIVTAVVASFIAK